MALLLALTAGSPRAAAVGIEVLRGAIRGEIKSATGKPQLGAIITLYNRVEKQIGKVISDDQGRFAFSALSPDQYSVRVSLAAFVPAVKRAIVVQPGMESLLAIRLTSVISSIELVQNAPRSTMMSDDWRWSLRSSSISRPVLRFDSLHPKTKTKVATSDVKGVFRLSAGDLGPLATGGSNPDLGTGFALVTPLDGAGDLRFSGNLGYVAASGAPMAAFRTAWETPGGARLNLTVRQLSRPGRIDNGATPPLRTISMGVFDVQHPTENLKVEYGAQMETIAFYRRLNLTSVFARGTLELSPQDRLQVAFSTGTMPLDLLIEKDSDSNLQRDLASLSLFPRVTMLGGRPRVQRNRNVEVGYQRKLGSRTFAFSLHREEINDATGLIAGDSESVAGLLRSDSLVQDISSQNFLANLGHYRSQGAIGSVTQHLGEHFETTLAFGSSGVLTTGSNTLASSSPEALATLLRTRMREWAMLRVNGVAPITGTRFSASYQWIESKGLTPTHLYLTQNLPSEAGLNFRVRQPVPHFLGMPGRLEASAEVRNLLAQGYLPLRLPDGSNLLLIHSPRAVRGGLSFIF